MCPSKRTFKGDVIETKNYFEKINSNKVLNFIDTFRKVLLQNLCNPMYNVTSSDLRKWTRSEEELLASLYSKSPNNWEFISSKFSGRSPKSCQARWSSIVSSGIHNKGYWTLQEDNVIKQAIADVSSAL